MPLLRKLLRAFILKNTDHIIVSNKSTYKNLTVLFPHKKVLFMPNGVFEEEIVFSRKKFNRLIFVGIFTYTENIEAVKNILKLTEMIGYPNKFEILVVGGPLHVLQTEIQRDPSYLKFLGHLRERDYHQLLKSTHIGLLPFFDKNELGGQRMKALEFLSHGLLTLSTLAGVRGIHGLRPDTHYLQFRNLHELKNLLQTIADNPHAYMAIARKGQQFIVKNYHWRKVTDSYIRLMTSLLQH